MYVCIYVYIWGPDRDPKERPLLPARFGEKEGGREEDREGRREGDK